MADLPTRHDRGWLNLRLRRPSEVSSASATSVPAEGACRVRAGMVGRKRGGGGGRRNKSTNHQKTRARKLVDSE